MTQIEFTLNNNTIKILGSQNEIMEDICKRFATKANANIIISFFYIREVQ